MMSQAKTTDLTRRTVVFRDRDLGCSVDRLVFSRRDRACYSEKG